MILADEPTGALDTRTSVEIMEILRRLNHDQGMTVIIVTHERDVAAYAARVLLVRDGELVGDGSLAEVEASSTNPGVGERPSPGPRAGLSQRERQTFSRPDGERETFPLALGDGSGEGRTSAIGTRDSQTGGIIR